MGPHGESDKSVVVTQIKFVEIAILASATLALDFETLATCGPNIVNAPCRGEYGKVESRQLLKGKCDSCPRHVAT